VVDLDDLRLIHSKNILLNSFIMDITLSKLAITENVLLLSTGMIHGYDGAILKKNVQDKEKV